MKPQFLRPLLEALTAGPQKNAAGEIKDVETLLQRDALRQLDQRHAGVYALFLFDLSADLPIKEYLESGSLRDDSGRHILALYESRRSESRKSGIIPQAGDLALEMQQERSLIAFARELFPQEHLTLPGIVVVERLAGSDSCLYVPLGQLPKDGTTQGIRKILACIAAAASASSPGAPFIHEAGVRLAKADFSYLSSAGISVREWLVQLLRTLWSCRRDLAAMIPVVGKLVAKPAKDP